MNKKGRFINLKNIFSTILNVIFYTILFILIFIIVLMVYYFISAKIYAKKGEKYQPPFSLYMIISPSMVPNINVYDVVLNKKVNDVKDLKVGDVITFKSNSIISNGLTVTHRINKIDKKDGKLIFTTKGDNNQNVDSGTVTQDNIYGKVILKLPQLGRVTSFLGNKGVWLIVVVIPALGIIIYDILKLFKLVGLKDKVIDIGKPINIKKNKKNENMQVLKTDNENDELYLLNKKNDENNKKENPKNMFYINQDKNNIPFELPKLKEEEKNDKK